MGDVVDVGGILSLGTFHGGYLMQMFPIKGSTRFTHYGFEPNTGGPKGLGMLALTFHGGKTYWYRGVPESLFENFLMAYSKGSFFSKFISDKFQHIQGE